MDVSFINYDLFSIHFELRTVLDYAFSALYIFTKIKRLLIHTLVNFAARNRIRIDGSVYTAEVFLVKPVCAFRY